MAGILGKAPTVLNSPFSAARKAGNAAFDHPSGNPVPELSIHGRLPVFLENPDGA